MNVAGKIIKIIIELSILAGLLILAWVGIWGIFVFFQIFFGFNVESFSFGIAILGIFAATVAFIGIGLSYHMIKNIIIDTRTLLKKST